MLKVMLCWSACGKPCLDGGSADDTHAGIESAWHLRRVQVLNSKTGELVTFKCQAWLDTTSEDGLIERDFYPVTDCSYLVELQVGFVFRV